MPMKEMTLNVYENDGSERLSEMVALNAYGSKGLWKWWLWMPKTVEVALDPYESDDSECQCESSGGFERLWRKMVALDA